MKIEETFIVWDEKNLIHVKLHYCRYLHDEKFFIERHDGKLQLISVDDAKKFLNTHSDHKRKNNMEKVIYKYSTISDSEFLPEFVIPMPKGAEILTIQVDKKNNHPCIWALVDANEPLEGRKFQLVGTGQNFTIDESKKYIGTYQYQNGDFVGHLFEVIR